MNDLTDHVAIITGASSGIGEATARALAAEGMRLVLTARRADALEALARDLPSAISVPGDITDPELPATLISSALEAFGRCDVVFNNAGVMEVGTVESADVERICRMVRVNVEAAYRMAYVALRQFRRQGSGYLINVSSILGTKVRPGAGAYAGTKFAIEALTEALRMELAGTAIQVCAVEPGLTRTHLQDHFPEHPAQALGLRQMLEPEDIARAVVFVLRQPAHVRIPRILVMPGEQAM